MPARPVRRALLSVSDKEGLGALGKALGDMGIDLLSTGGTAASLRDAGVAVIDVAQVTGAPEILGGRVKTLHPHIHGGLLARRDDAGHKAALDQHGIGEIDLLVVNLYPFEAARARHAPFAETIEMIDVGGPAMIRAAAKNHAGVAVIIEPGDYPALLDELRNHGGTTDAFRLELARKAFARTAAYDAMIAEWLGSKTGVLLPERITLAGDRRQELRYGENPQQRAAFYATMTAGPSVARANQVQGKELSYNNILDTDAALALAAEYDMPAAAIIKHANPCGVATNEDLESAYRRALACDPVSAFGGIVAFNRPLDGATARAVCEVFTEAVIAPGADKAALDVFAERKNLRLLLIDGMPAAADPADGAPLLFRSVAGGFLVQEADQAPPDPTGFKIVTKRSPSAAEMADLLFAWRAVRHVKSNAILFAREQAAVGVGMGQTNRLDSVRIGIERMRAGPGPGPCVVASDAFFPFADGLVASIEGGATAAIQPGGSVRDQEVIEAADARGIAMIVTGVRHFRH